MPRKPPAPRYEQPPPRPGPDYAWIPGHWIYRAGRYHWIEGTWVLRPMHAIGWAAGAWEERDGGWVWLPGRWIVPKSQTEVEAGD